MLVHEFHNFIISENGLGILVGVTLEIQKLGYTEQYHKLSMLLSNSGSDVVVNYHPTVALICLENTLDNI